MPHAVDAILEVNELVDGFTSAIHAREPRTKKQQIDHLLLRLDALTDLIYDANQAHVCFDKYILAFGIQRFTLGGDTVGGILGLAYEVDAWLDGVFCELLEGRFADAASGADEDCDELRWESGRDEVVGGLNEGEGDHFAASLLCWM